jgi:hypothetical protein
MIFISSFLIAALAASVEAMPRTPAPGKDPQTPQAAPSPLLAEMTAELNRNMPVLSKATPPAYFINYTLTQAKPEEPRQESNPALRLHRWKTIRQFCAAPFGWKPIDNIARLPKNWSEFKRIRK